MGQWEGGNVGNVGGVCAMGSLRESVGMGSMVSGI